MVHNDLPTTAKPKVALGMSGGVDSSVCAHLLIEAGYEVTGIFLECWRAPGCRSEEDRKDALKIALDLNIPFQVLDFKQAYKDKVVEYFFDEYHQGRTPNPDVMCNKEIKFGLFYDWAMAQGYDYVATGHYADLGRTEQGEIFLQTPTDEHKDQTYFLYRLTADHLRHVLFPLGNLTKPQVRAEAERRGLHVATKKDSVGICFIGDINVHNFLEERLGKNPGQVVDVHGTVIGDHQGLWFYTVGQRHGFTVNTTTLVKQSDGSTINKHNIPPFYVIKKVPGKNQLVVGFGPETYFQEFTIQDPHWISQPPHESKLLVRIRHTGKLLPATLKDNHVHLDAPVQGLAEGQSAVFYTSLPTGGYRCWGGGIISC
ncbi:MAG TPA: tRNA 2-thiouridine(34) synthase MnmA [Vitreimonas sp.]|nr:tRNA 2-thiouridine(34) synthase MnmA [Vitreimonas sp.]